MTDPSKQTNPPARLQLHITLPYKDPVGAHPSVRPLLEAGYRIRHLQRLSDREAIVTLSRPAA